MAMRSTAYTIGPLYVPDIHVSVFMLGAAPHIPIIQCLQLPARREGPRDDFHSSLSRVPSCEERASPGAVDDETRTARTELPLQSES